MKAKLSTKTYSLSLNDVALSAGINDEYLIKAEVQGDTLILTTSPEKPSEATSRGGYSK